MWSWQVSRAVRGGKPTTIPSIYHVLFCHRSTDPCHDRHHLSRVRSFAAAWLPLWWGLSAWCQSPHADIFHTFSPVAAVLIYIICTAVENEKLIRKKLTEAHFTVSILGGRFSTCLELTSHFQTCKKRSNFTIHKFLDIDTLDHLECVSLVLATPREQYKVYKLYWSKDNSNL